MAKDLYGQLLDLPSRNYYEIMGLPLFESDQDTIHKAVLQQTKNLRRWTLDPDAGRADRVQELLNEVSRAGVVLQDPEAKADYDRELADRMGIPRPESRDAFQVAEPPETPREEKQVPRLSLASIAFWLGISVIVAALAVGGVMLTRGPKQEPPEDTVAHGKPPVAKQPPQDKKPDLPRPLMQYRVACKQVASIEKELAQKKKLHTDTSPVVKTLQKELSAARAEQERLAGASMKSLRARLEALQGRQAEMRKEIAPTHPKMKQLAATIQRAESDLAAMVGEAGRSDAVRQYRVACKQVASIERKLAQKKELHTDTSPVVKTLQKELSAARAEQERHRTTAMKSMVAALQALTRRQADIRKALRKEMPKEMRLTDPKMKEARAATSAGEGVPAPAVGEAAVKRYEVASAQVATIERELAQKIKLHADTSPVVTTLQKELSSARAEQEVHRKAVTEWMVAVLQALMLQQAGMRKGMQSTPPKVKQMDAAIRSAAQDLALLLGGLPEMSIRQILAALIDGVPLTIALDLGGGVTMGLVYIPSGEFMMGSPVNEKDRKYSEGPQHRVRITKPFYIGICEVTQAQYEAVMGKNPARFKGAENPIEQVSWHDCVEFCKRLSRKTGRTVRLLTEAEWEYACRAGTRTPFFFGETISTDQANYDGDYTYGKGKKGVDRKKIVPVGSFPPNGFGLYDMHGNVWEWCADWYDEDYYKQSPTDDPQGPRRGKRRVLRGGSWFGTPGRCRSAFRNWYGPTYAFDLYGFRVAVVVQEFN